MRRSGASGRGRATLLALALLGGGVAAAEELRDWLARMDRAVETLNYHGVLVHMHGGEADVLRIVHRVEDGRVTERITSVDGPGREIIRDDDHVTCIMPDQQAVLVEPRDERDGSQSPLRGRLPLLEAFNADFYTLAFVAGGKVAGRDTRAISVQPRDDYRYGYGLWLDELTGMPLKVQLRDAAGVVVEEIMFADITLPPAIDAEDVRPSMTTESYATKRMPARIDEPADARAPAWEATELPAGFRLTVSHARAAANGAPTRQMVYSDGLASVSVFIDSGLGAGESGEGASMMGGANAYTTRQNGHVITAIGEVPMRTVELIAHAMRPLSQP